MEMETTDGASARWNKLPEDLQMRVLSGLPVESVYRFRIVSKKWKDWLSSNNFLTLWSEVTKKYTKQPRLVLLDRNPKMPSMSFCFHTRTWIRSCFTLCFVEDWIPETCRRDLGVHCSSSAGGLILVCPAFRASLPARLCNPYKRTFIEIPASSIETYGECIVVGENNNWGYKVVAVGYAPPDANGLERPAVDIYEPFQKRWNIAGYLPDDIILPIFNDLIFCNGSFYCYWQMPGYDMHSGIVSFTIPLEGNGSAVAPIPIPVVLLPFPEIVRNVDHDDDVLFHPRMITCGSRLLLIAGKRMAIHVGQIDGEGEKEVAIILWELRADDDRSESWKWVEITRMPPSVRKDQIPADEYCNRCTGVGDHVCFIAPPHSFGQPIEVLDYNLIDNTWNWLPSCPRNHHCVGEEGCTGGLYDTLAFQPRPYKQVE